MFSKDFLFKVVKEAAVAFVVTGGGVLLASPDSFHTAVLVGAAVAGLRAVVGVIVKDVTVLGGDENTPSL